MVTSLRGIVSMETGFYLNTGGSKQQGALDEHSGCELLQATDSTGDVAADFMMQYQKKNLLIYW